MTELSEGGNVKDVSHKVNNDNINHHHQVLQILSREEKGSHERSTLSERSLSSPLPAAAAQTPCFH